MTHTTYTGNDAIARGYQLYDEWKSEGQTSRGIVELVKRSRELLDVKNTEATRFEALACLFALDARIKETYHAFLRRLFSFFSWRREVRALKLLKGALGIPSTEKNIRTAIEIGLQQLREMRKEQGTDDADDEVHGGRKAEAEEQTVTAQAKQQEQTAQEEAPDEELQNSDTEQSKDAPEEQAQEFSEQAPKKEQTAARSSDQRETADPGREEAEAALRDDGQKAEPKDRSEQKRENSGTDTIPEPSTDKQAEPKTYNDAFDFPPLPNEPTGKQNEDKISFIDEVIMDNMIKGKEDYLTHNPLEDVKRESEGNERADALPREDAGNKTADKDAHLYDEMVMDGKDGGLQETQAPSEKSAKQSVGQVQNSNTDAKELEDLRTSLQADVSLEHDNEKRREISNNMSEAQIIKQYHSQAAEMRKQLEIASAELGIDAPVEIIGKPEAPKTEKPTFVATRK